MDTSQYQKFLKLREIINAGEAVGAIARPNQTRRALKMVWSKDWEIDWCESFILLNCITRKVPARTHGALEKLRKLYATQPDGRVQFDIFFERIKIILAPDFITPHGYTRTFNSRDAGPIMSAAQSIVSALEEFEFPVMLYAGTLLGLVRDGALIGHDDDMDFAVYLGEIRAGDVPEKWLRFKQALCDKGILTDAYVTSSSASFKIVTDEVEIDLFPCWTENSRFSVYPYSLNDVAQNDIFPLKIFGDTLFLAPKKPEALLAQSYGENWRIPDPLFHFNWKRAKKRFSHLCSTDFSLSQNDFNRMP